MKRIGFVLLAVCMAFNILSGCSAAKPVAYDLAALSEQVGQSGAFTDFLSPVTETIAATFYGFEETEVTESDVRLSTGATTEEIALFKCADETAAAKLKANAETRVETQRSIYESYAPGEMPKLDDAIVVRNGLYVFYIVSADAAKVRTVLDGYGK
ncbi:MAG: DUF4358 domain-containing protein [Oscillospiraceae bacterium]|jgi:hypothetical protein|nr:DUF4358 domain-containing protein [Oscillospiraceae bacterium]